jgi:hypothetical protein
MVAAGDVDRDVEDTRVSNLLTIVSLRWWRTPPTVASYIAGGIVLVLAAARNPIDFRYVAISGVGGSFGLTWGLLGIPGAVGSHSGGGPGKTKALGFAPAWVTVAVVVAILFVGVMGHGVRFSP